MFRGLVVVKMSDSAHFVEYLANTIHLHLHLSVDEVPEQLVEKVVLREWFRTRKESQNKFKHIIGRESVSM